MRSALRSPRLWLGLAISVLALALAVRGVSWSNVRTELVGAQYGWLLPAALVIAVGQVARAARWQAMFGTGPRPGLQMAFAILSVGYLVSILLPLRLGDFARAWLIGVYTPAGATEALATVMLERVVDLITIVGLVAVIVPAPAAALLTTLLGPGPWSNPAFVRLVSLLAVGALFLALVILARLARPVRRAVVQVVDRLGFGQDRAVRSGDIVGRFLAALGALRQPRVATAVAAWSIAIWLIGGLQYWFVMKAFHLPLSFGAAMFALGATALWAILPSSPGYLGVFHHAIRVSVPAVAPTVSPDTALSYAVVLHGWTMAVLLLMGIVGLLMLGISLPELVRRSTADQAAL